MSWKHFNLGTNEGGVTNLISVSEEGEIVARDFQSKAVNQVIADECRRMRAMTSNGGPPGFGQGYIAAKVPITIWQNHRRAWMRVYSKYYTWQEYWVRMLNKDPELQEYKCIEGNIHLPQQVRG